MRRKLLRLPGYDYRQPGAYFFTTVIHNRANLLGSISDSSFFASDAGRIVLKAWQDLPKHYPHVVLDVFSIMPNHVHGIIFLEEVSFGSGRGGSIELTPQTPHLPDPPLPGMQRHGLPDISLEESPFGSGRGGSVELTPETPHLPDPPLPGMQRHGLQEIIRAFKSFSARRINLMRGTSGKPVWQRNYYEHIVRDQKGLEQIQNYILGNVALWEQDRFFQKQ